MRVTFFGFFNITIIIIQSFVLFTMVIVRLIILRIHHANLQKGNLEGQEKLSQFLLFVVLVLPMVYNMVMVGDGDRPCLP